MKPMTALITAAIFSVLSLNACGDSEKSMSIQEQTEARFQLNPHPKQAYRLKIKINDAPGPLKLMGSMSVGYGARNCSYIINRIEGVAANPEKDLEIEVRQLGEFEYEAIVYTDAMQDENYFNEGVCHWQIEGFGLGFKATGEPSETRFSFGDIFNDLIEKKTLTKYFSKKAYPYSVTKDNSIFPNYVDSGLPSLKLYNIEKYRNDMFTITVTLEEVQS